MASGSECPNCRRDIGLWGIIKAPLPNRIYCPHCRERLWYRDAGLLITVFAVILVALIAASLGAAWAVGSDEPLLALGAAVAVLVAGFVPFEVAYALCLRYGDYQLALADAPDDWDEEEPF